MCIIQINFTFVWNKYYNIIMLSIAERHKHILDKLNAQGFVKVLDIGRDTCNDTKRLEITGRKEIAISYTWKRQSGKPSHGRYQYTY